MKKRLAVLMFSLAMTPVFADEPVITDVAVKKVGMVWNFKVTVEHPDTGWDHYADGWEILDSNGKQIGYRKLLHPHVEEQPFTRSLTGVVIPDGTREVFVRAKCSVDGWSSEKIRVELSP